MEDFEDFEAVFGSEVDLVFHRDEIRKHRNALEGELFVDRLLRAIGLLNGQSAGLSLILSSIKAN